MKVNGLRVKPAATVREGDVIEFLQGSHFRRVVVVGMPETNVSKEVARTMFVDETPKQDVEVAKGMFRDRGTGRPTKKDRRDIDRLRR